MSTQNEKINYLELPSSNFADTKRFFSEVFGWQFEDYGDDYIAFAATEAGLDGGFYRSDLVANTDQGSALVVFYSDDLSRTQAKVEQQGGTIKQAIFEFPGGRRFHFTDPHGNEYAVWSDQN